MNCSAVLDVIKKVMNQTELAFEKKWGILPIQDNGEVLVKIPDEFCYPFYADTLKIIKDRRIFVRKTVLSMLRKARRTVGRLGMDLMIYDGWRSLKLQEYLYWLYMKQFSIANFSEITPQFYDVYFPEEIKKVFGSLPGEIKDNLHALNRRYVSWPSEDCFSPSPHVTGGAVDVWLFKDGKSVDLGVEFDSMEESSGAFYHLRSGRTSFPNDDLVCYHRNVLLWAMIDAGFSCYPPEIWHFNYGNQMHSLVTGEVARYSYVEP